MAYAQTPIYEEEVRPDDHGHSHPGEREYIRIAVILACITAVEVGIYYWGAVRDFLVPMLIVLSTVKFVLVVGYFMHLKFDDKRLAWIFTAAMGVALSIYIGTWALQHYHHITEFISNMNVPG